MKGICGEEMFWSHCDVRGSWVWGLITKLASFIEHSHAEDGMQPCCASTDIKLKSNQPINSICTVSIKCLNLSHAARLLPERVWLCLTCLAHTGYSAKNGAMWIHVL